MEANAETYFSQAFRVLEPNRTEVRRNSEWLGAMTAADILRLLGRQTLQSVLQREDFAKRLKEGHPIGAHEILYPFSQAYDSVAVDADLEIGGTDQLFNLLYGRDIMRAYDKTPQDIAVFPLLEGLDGVNKMSKSLGNYIGIAEPPDEVYGKVMSIPDSMTARYAKLLLHREDLPDDPRDAKAAVARGLVERLHGGRAAAEAEAEWERRFRRGEQPSEIAEVRPREPNLITVILEAGFAKSASEARRLLSQGGVRVNGEKVAEDLNLADGDVLSVGKRNFVRVKLG